MRITFRKTVSETGKVEFVWKNFKVVVWDDESVFYVRGNRDKRNGYWSIKKVYPDELQNENPGNKDPK